MTLRQAVDRYGAAAVIVVALALLVILTPAKSNSSDSSVDTGNNNLAVGGTNAGSGTDQFTTDSTLPDGTA
ncbi:MAG: hypothetical protein QOI61_1471, partial [Actinomycetota bacterium]